MRPITKRLVRTPPHLHSLALVTRATIRPVPLVISRLPVTCSGPLTCGSICRGPSRTASMSVEVPVAGSPVASKWTSWWELSQYGLFFEAPQRHRVAQ
jgi:hypothetical protein